jgi:lysophospholipase L1-like esterase
MDGRICFLGDSLTEHGSWEELFPFANISNFGISGNKTYDINNRLDEILSIQPSKLFLMVGINDLGDHRAVDEILDDYNIIVQNIRKHLEGTSTFLLSILPVGETRIVEEKLTLKTIESLNYSIKEIAQKNDMVFINMNTAFSDENGYLKQVYTYDDLHLSHDGYLLWKELIKNYL